MQRNASTAHSSRRRCLGWIVLGLCIILAGIGAGSVLLQALGCRYRDLAVYAACAVFAALCAEASLYLAALRPSHFRGFITRALLYLLLSALICCIFLPFVLFRYTGEITNDGWYAPPDKIVFNDGYLMRTHIRVYEPGTLFWTGPHLPAYEYTD